MQLADLGHTDVGESLDDMKVAGGASAHRRIPTSRTARRRRCRRAVRRRRRLPHIFVFDQARTLQYQGRIDDNAREDAS